MKTILEGNSSIIKAWGLQKIKNTDYRLIRYTLHTDCDDGILLYNVVTGKLVLLDAEEAYALEHLQSTDINVMKPLIEQHFLVPINYNEERSVNQLRLLLKKLRRTKAINNFTILPTTGCNARCFYCYESNFPNITMTESIAHDVVNYIISHCDKNKKINIHWFGGEPLLGSTRINQICEELSKADLSFSSRMTSNAFLFSKDLVAVAKEKWFLKKVQITLDGTEAVYNSAKSFIKVESSPYYQVLNNISYLLDQKIYVVIRLNLGKHNIDDLKGLIDELSAMFPSKQYLGAYVDILFEDAGFEPIHHSEEDITSLEKVRIQLNNYIHKKGFHSPVQRTLQYLSYTHCMADSDSCLLINPKGDLSLCEHAIIDNSIGTIYADSLDYQKVSEWSNIKNWKKCKECPLYPTCVMLEKCINLRPCHEVRLADKLKQYYKLMKDQYHRILYNC